MINRLIRNYTFTNDIRSSLTFSDVDLLRLNIDSLTRQGLQLKADSDGFFSTDDDLFIETDFIEVNALLGWLSFEARFELKDVFPKTNELPDGTSLGFKLKTTAGNYFWDGGAWAIAGLGDWNTEDVIRANIPTFPIATVGNKKMAVVINLKTTDKNVTPFVTEVKFLADVQIEYFQDMVYDSVIRLLNTEFRTSSRVAFRAKTSISSINLDTILRDKGYNIFGIRSVYNRTDDPLKLTNLFDAYTLGAARRDGFTFEAGVVDFLSAIPSGKIVDIEFEYLPEIKVKTGQDFYEVKSYPCIIFHRINEVLRKGFTLQESNSQGVDFIKLDESINAVQLSPTQKSFRFGYHVYTATQTDQMRLIKDLHKFLSDNATIKLWGLGNHCDLDIVDVLDTVGNSQTNDRSDTNIAKGIFDLLGVLFYDKSSVDAPIVKTTNVTIM